MLFDRGKNDLLARLEFVFRFQDDLISFNDHGLLQDSLCEIYPPVMIVNNTNISACKSNFLDMTISIYQGKFYFSLYDKRNDYDFDVISFPFLDGNIPKGQSYGVFISQLVRYARINCSFSRFIDDVNTPAPCPENRAGFTSGIPWIKFGKTEQLLHAQNSVNLSKF